MLWFGRSRGRVIDGFTAPTSTGSALFDALLQRAGAGAAMRDGVPPPWTWTAEISGDTGTRAARAACRAYLMRHAVPNDDAFSAADIIVGEVLANVERHAPGPAELHLDWNCRHARLLVLDRGPGFGAEPRTTLRDPYAESGRGLAIIALLAVEHTYGNRHDGGAWVCVLLPLERDAS
jgi:anti-sigma regulatory factor (Ser/Thr protein kinase)